MNTSPEPRSFKTPEFWLVVIMLGILTLLILFVLRVPINLNGSIKPPNQAAAQVDAKAILDFRRTILTIILTAFGAWVGAGAAYYFGRENLRESASSLLKMRDLSGRELLRQTPISQIPPRKIEWTVKTSEELGKVMAKLKDDPDLWFLVVVRGDDTLETVIHEEAIWRFVEAEVSDGRTYADIGQKQIADVLTFIKKDKKLVDRVGKIYVPVTPENTTELASVRMENKKVSLAVICDENGKPTQYITTGDLRLLLVRGG
jgi:hypothetical protein